MAGLYPEFDIRRLWEAAEPSDHEPISREISRRPPKLPAAVISLRASVKIEPEDADTCRGRTQAELLSIALSLRRRDAVRRGWIADRCAACRRCPDMVG